MIQLFNDVSSRCSRQTTLIYSTSFNSAIRLLHKDLRRPVHNIYGLVRFADEIVDTFHDYDKQTLLEEFRRDTFLAIDRRISLNPILNSFQDTVHKYNIEHELIDAFFNSMEADLTPGNYNNNSYREYIYGSAEVVGLMCLNVFCEGNKTQYQKLKPYAQALGAAFQKVNFLRDLSADYNDLKRTYFPGVDFRNFTERNKKEIEADIAEDFKMAYSGILMLPSKARFGVYVAYRYYLSLFRKISKSHPAVILEDRVRIPNLSKAMIIMKASVRNHLNLI